MLTLAQRLVSSALALGLILLLATAALAQTRVNGRIAFASNRDLTHTEIYTMEPDGSNLVRLTVNTTPDDQPTWSPDGTRIAYRCFGNPSGNSGLCVMNSDGTGQRRLTDGAHADDQPAWSPDGRSIAFVRALGLSQIFTMGADGSNQTQITFLQTNSDSPTWSPDGQSIAFGTNINLNFEVAKTPASPGKPVTNLTNSPDNDTAPSWSSDGRIAFTRAHDGELEIYVMNDDGTNQTQVTNSPGRRDDNACWSPDNTRIAFTSNPDVGDDVYTINPNGTNEIRLTINSSLTDTAPAWQVAPTAAARLRFSQASYSAAETAVDPVTDPVVILTVTRSGDLSGTSKVEFQTVDDPSPVPCDPTVPGGPYPQGVAYARCDYATTIDTLSFAPGESQKFFRIPLVNDSHVEQPEIFTVVLNNPEGAALDAQYSAIVTINDDDTGAGPNPVNNHQFFVRQHYLDFLSREPEAGGFNAWFNVLNNCPNPFNIEPNSPSAGCDRIIVSSSFFRSQEFEIKGFYVYKFYRVAFHNPPSNLPAYAEISRDMRSVTGQTSQEVYAKKAAYANAFVQRSAFRTAYEGLSNAAYVGALLGPYNLTAITTTDPANPDTGNQVTLTQGDLISRLDNMDLTRAQVLRAVVQSQEVNAAEFNGAFVAMQYYGYLRRTPDEPGYNAWLAYLNAHPGDFRTMVHGFLYSQEYVLRFGPISTSNLASGQSATQSSEAWGGVASRANDGNADGNYGNGSVTHTQVESQPWWQLDLGGVRTINSIQLWNRTDCCMERLSNFYVFVSDAPFTSTDLQTTLNQPGVSSYYTAGQSGSPTTIVVNRTGRYVRVQLAGSNILSLAEVKVWGR